MGTDIAEVVEKLPSPFDIKVHSVMCTELMKMVSRVLKIFPEIEAARPRCSSGIQSLCLLNSAIDKARSLIQDCCESSKLYLALTGSKVLTGCKRSKSLLEQSLSQIQNMVPVMLASEISQIIAELRGVTFSLDPSEEAAGKAVKASLEQYKTGNSSAKEPAVERIQIAALKLRITSQKALLIERRSIKKILNKLGDNNDKQLKRQILFFLLDMLKRCGKSITSEQPENDQDFQTPKIDSYVDLQEGQNMLGRANGAPPEEFKCPISRKLMYDPVVIDSGLTFERMWIQKWFDEGHDTCPKSKRKLSHFYLTPNMVMKDLITRWCESHGVTVSDPSIQLSTDMNMWENSSSSINSLTISMNNLQLPVDYSSVSLSSLENSQSSLSSYSKAADVPARFQSLADSTRDLAVELSRNLDGSLPWESQCKAVEDLMTCLKRDDQACKLISSENLVESLVRFLNTARDTHDVKAQRIGCFLLLVLVNKCRSVPYLNKDAYHLLAMFLESEVIEEALAIIEVLSSHQNSCSDIAESGALTSIFKILDTQIKEIQTPALKILRNLTSTRKVRSLIVSSHLIPKLIPFFEDDSVSRYCIAILANLCDNQDTKSVIAETNGCLSFISSVLESESREEQEQALEILLSLCSQSVGYCHLVMSTGVIPAVVSITANGNDKGKAKATEMLRVLRDVEYEDDVDESPAHDSASSVDSNKEKKTSSRASRFFSKLSIISRGSLAQKRKI